MLTKQQVEEQLRKCKDPELDMNIITLGLVYDIQIIGGNTVNIRMTFTSYTCPYGPAMAQNAKDLVMKIEGVKDANIEIVFDPPWQPSDELKALLGI